MITEENLAKLYDGVIEKTELTTKELNSYGLNSKDLNELIQEGIIKRIKRGLYSLESVDKLFYYGKRLLALNEQSRATLCFEKCFELNPNHLGACFQLFLRSIKKEDYQKAFELFDKLSQSDNEYYNIDHNYYLYLLNIITDIPEKYREYAKFLRFYDIRISYSDKRYEDTALQNKVRSYVLQQKFSYALKLLNDLIAKHKKQTVQDMITKTLLIQAINAETLSKNTIINLIKEKKYEEVISHLLKKQNKHNLSMSEEYILKLAQKIIEIKTTSVIPSISIIKSETFFEAIDGENYTVALNLNKEFNKEKNIENKSNAIYLLLNDLCNLINELSIPKQEKVIVQPKINENQNSNNQPIITFSQVLSFLMKNDLDNAFKSLKIYMKQLEKQDFEFLIIDLIKISLLERDMAFTKPMLALTLISKENYSFDVSNYIQEFYICLSQNKFEEARIYLDIISKANKLGQEQIITDVLYQALEMSEKLLNYKRDNTQLETVEKTEEKNKIQSLSEVSPIEEAIIQEETVQQISKEKLDSEKLFLEKKHEELVSKKSMILLKPMDKERTDRLLEMLEEYQDIVAFVIEDENQLRIVLKYKLITEEHIDKKELFKLGNQAYNEGNYNECIKNYSQLLRIIDNPKSFVFTKLGLSFMKNWYISLAIDYLTVANYLYKKEKTDWDLTDLIFSLKGYILEEDTKPTFKKSQNNFDYDDINNYYGIDNFDDINNYIIESGLDVESACQELNIPPEQINIILLIYAREFYIQGNFEKGDLFLKAVEQSKNKTKEIIKLLEEIRKRKKFYQNKIIENPRQLVYSLQPSKKYKK